MFDVRRPSVPVAILATLVGMLVVLGPARPASALTFTAPTGSPFTLGGSPESVAIGDLNADGKADLATANSDTNQVTVLLGNGSGGFTPAPGPPPAAGQFPVSVAIGDLNADGKPDLAIANANSNNVTVLLGDGSGAFAPVLGQPFAVGTAPRSVAIGDLNADGNPDLVTANFGSNDVTVLLGDGSGAFTRIAPGPSFVVGTAPRSVAIGDLNADGKPDLATANMTSNDVTVLLGKGTGRFTVAPGSPFAVGTAPCSVAIGDLNADGKPDLATANFGSTDVTVLLGNGIGGFTPAPGPMSAAGLPYSVAIGDLNADGTPDLVTANVGAHSLTVLLGNGSGAFRPAIGSPFAVGEDPNSVAIGDVNADGKPDLATANHGSSDVTVLLNSSVAARTVSSSALIFGTQAQSTLSAAQTVTVTSTGDVPLQITRVARTGPDRGEFLLSDDTCSGQTLARDDTCTVDVRFAPTSPGATSATLSITDNTAASTDLATLSGTGGDLPAGPVGALGPTGQAGETGAAGVAGTAGAAGARGAAGPSRTVTCKVTKTKSAKKIKVTCTVKTNKRATARLTSHGRTIARRTLKAGTRRVTFTVTHASRPTHYRLKIRQSS